VGGAIMIVIKVASCTFGATVLRTRAEAALIIKKQHFQIDRVFRQVAHGETSTTKVASRSATISATPLSKHLSIQNSFRCPIAR
jgi:hypothetical protein